MAKNNYLSFSFPHNTIMKCCTTLHNQGAKTTLMKTHTHTSHGLYEVILHVNSGRRLEGTQSQFSMSCKSPLLWHHFGSSNTALPTTYVALVLGVESQPWLAQGGKLLRITRLLSSTMRHNSSQGQAVGQKQNIF